MNTTGLIFLLLVGFFNTLTASPAQQLGEHVVTIRLRDANGDPIVGETVTLWQPFPVDEPISPTCKTDESGECAWTVARGLYAVVFESLELDELSALSVGEAGLFGLGLTVGDHDIAYNFTVANEDKIYFDAAPDSPIPQPIIPSMEDVNEHWFGGSADPNAALEATEEKPTPTPTAKTDTVAAPTDGDTFQSGEGEAQEGVWTVERYWPHLRFLLLIAAAIGLGYGGHKWQRGRKAKQERLAKQQKTAPGATTTTRIGEGD